MAVKISRYRKLPDIVTTDSGGRRLRSLPFRTVPDVSGTFRHTVVEVDRLDHLAHKYYGQPRKWWRICDANSEFMSPLALLGKEPVAKARFSLTFAGTGDSPPWSDLIRTLSEEIGVEDVKVSEEIHLIAEQQTHVERAVTVTYNRENISAEDLAGIIKAAGYNVAKPEVIGRVGKIIYIPPDVAG